MNYWLPILFFAALTASAQLPVEILVGKERTTADMLWFRPFLDSAGNATRFLFFGRNRTSVDYSNNTRFGTTLAVSYNMPSGVGFVFSGQFFNDGFFPKAGIQYFQKANDWLIFTWLTAELLQKSRLDWFALTRWEPQLSVRFKGFSQLELLATTDWEGNLSLIQRLRVGLGFSGHWQAGLGIDLSQAGKSNLTTSNNVGIFIRKDF